jgi:hypothetical protein
VPAGGSGTAIVVERADSALVVRSMDADASAVGFAAALPPEPSRTAVVVDPSAVSALHALDDDVLRRLVDRLNAGAPGLARRDVRLVAAGAGGPDSSGAPPLAARLADWLGVGVVAPEGELIALRGGELFSVGPGAGWLDFRRESPPHWTGPRYPAPGWQAALPREFRLRRPRALARRRSSATPVTVTAIPAGLWVRVSGSAPLSPADLGYGVPVESVRPVVLVGAPGEPTPGVAELVDFFASLPSDLRKSAVLAPYGPDPDAHATLVQNLADRLGMPIHAYHALPHYAADGTRRFAFFGTSGRPDRLTDAPEWLHLPGTAQVRVMPVEEPSALADSPPADPVVQQGDPNATLVDPIVSQGHSNTAVIDPVPPQTPVGQAADPVVRPSAPGRGASTTTMVTVDARGFLRPCGRTRQYVMARDGIPARSAHTAAYASDADPAASGPAELRTVVSTEVPQVRSAAHAVTVRSRAAAPHGQADRTPTAKPVVQPPHSRPSLNEPEAGAGTVPARALSVKHMAPQDPRSEPTAEATDESDGSSQGVRPHEPIVAPRPSPATGSDRESDLVPLRAQPVVESPPAEVDRRWLAHQVSTAEDRQAFRASLGWRYDAAARSVARLLAEQPGLRGAGDADEALMTDLAAVRVFAIGDRADFVRSVRSGGSESDRPFAVCVAAGLRRLPSFQGAVVCGGPADPEAANAYRVGQELTEAAPLTAFDAVGAHVPGAVEFLLWSATARRLSGFGGDSPYAELAFLPGTIFRVLAVDPEDTSPVRRVLLAEIPSGRSPKQTWLDRVRARLEEAAATRASLPRTAAVANDGGEVILGSGRSQAEVVGQ